MEEVKESFKGTFLEGAPLHLVSSVRLAGIPELKRMLPVCPSLAAGIGDAPLRIPVDRVFTIAGFGTVVTGTIISGTVKTGEIVEVVPRVKFRVRPSSSRRSVGRPLPGSEHGKPLRVGEKEVLRRQCGSGTRLFSPNTLSGYQVKTAFIRSQNSGKFVARPSLSGCCGSLPKLLLLGCDELAPEKRALFNAPG